MHTRICARARTCIHAYVHTHTHMHTSHAYAYMHMHTCMRLGKRAMPNGNPLASALGEDPFIPLNTHITRKSKSKTKAHLYHQSPFVPVRANILDDDRSFSPVGGGEERDGPPFRPRRRKEGWPTELEVAPLAWEITPGGAPLPPPPTLGGKQEVPRRPPSWRTHSIITRVGPGGEHGIPILDCAIEPTRPLGGDLGT